MRYLRMLANAVAGGALGASYVTVLLFQLNPQVPLVSGTALHWALAIAGLYGLQLSIAIYLMMLVRDGLAWQPLQPAWLSVRLLAWLAAVLAGLASLLTWANLKGLRAVLDDAAFARASSGATATTVCAAVLLAVAIVRYSFGRRGGRATGAVFAATVALSVLLPTWLRGPGDLPVPVVQRPQTPLSLASSPPAVHVIALDGASLNFIRERVAAGRLPNFGRILDRGAVIYLATLKPTQAGPIWTAAATGKYPPKDGIRSSGTYRVGAGDTDAVDLLPDYCFAYSMLYLGFVKPVGATAAAVRARPVWDILSDYGVSAGVVRWPLTFPARIGLGYVISDRFDLAGSSPLRLMDAEAGWPTTATEIARDAFDSMEAAEWPDTYPFAPTAAAATGAARWDPVYSRAAQALDRQFAPRFTAIRYVGLDVIGHRYLKYAEPDRFGDVTPDDVRRYGGILDGYYGYIDAEIGRTLSDLGPDDLLLVMSGFGMDEQSLAKRLLARALGRTEQSGTHEAAPDGFLLAYGAKVAQGQFPRGAIVDLAPTVLYYMGVPVGRDMDGYARADLFTSAFTLEHPITRIPTYGR